VNKDQAQLLLEEAADALEAGEISPSLRQFAVQVLRAIAQNRPLPGVQDTRGNKCALDPYTALEQVCAEMDRRGGPEHFKHAVDHVAALHEVDERTVRRALKRITMNDRGLELIALARRTK